MLPLSDLVNARSIVSRAMAPTPQYQWPLLCEAIGTDIRVKHENHTPTGAFKVRGGLVYVERLLKQEPDIAGLVCATRGNHGQSIAFAAKRAGLLCRIVVPHGNSREKNAAMRAFGGEVIEHGQDFDDAFAEARRMAQADGLHLVPSFHPDLVAGVGTYGLELFEAEPDLDIVYAPVGLGSGLCGLIAARDGLGASARIVGVVSDKADAYARSFAAGRVVEVDHIATFADGIAVREPHAEALDVIRRGAETVVTVSEDAIADAIRLYYRATHNIAEGAGAAALAAAMQDKTDLTGKKVGVILCGQNIDTDWYADVLGGGTPVPR
ncbi:MAG: threonine dehydratase [Pseudomonadota bacterium]